MTGLSERTVRDIALESPASVRVFEEYNIDYCCGGGKSLDDACRAADAPTETVSEKLSAVLAENAGAPLEDSPENKSATGLIRYIIDKHHYFARREMERLKPLLDKVCEKHGQNHEELYRLRDGYGNLCSELAPHMQKEEVVLFPFIESLDIAIASDLTPPTAPFGTVQNPIRMMMFEHETAGAILKEMREVSGDYKPPADACPSFNALYFGLEELERDLHRHIHLENNLLFPMAAKLEDPAV